jgi:transcriptional regulator with XRE-family HTH domain
MEINNNLLIVKKIRMRGAEVGLSTDAQILKKASLGKSALADIERAKTTPQLGTLHKIAQALECSIDELVYETSQTIYSELHRGWPSLEKSKKIEVNEIIQSLLTLQRYGLDKKGDPDNGMDSQKAA